MTRRLLVTALLLLAAALVLPSGASAHAALESASPADKERLASAPAQVTLRFTEPVEASFSTVRIKDSAGKRVDEGPVFHAGRGANTLALRLRPGLRGGAYVVTYRVVSKDGHPIAGRHVFAVANGRLDSVRDIDAGVGAEEDAGAGTTTSVAFAAMRALQYGAIALAIGMLAFVLVVWVPALRSVAGGEARWAGASEAFAAHTRTVLIVAAAAGEFSGQMMLILQGAVAGGTSALDAARPEVVADVIGTRYGTVWGIALIAWGVLLALALVLRQPVPVLRAASLGADGLALRGGRAVWLLLAAPAVWLAIAPGLGGHAATQNPVWLLLPANVVHVLGMGAWLGGVAVLAYAAAGAARQLGERDRVALLAFVTARFSRLAGIAVVTILATGVLQAALALESPARLLDTGYGRSVAIKIVAFAAIVALGWLNRRRLLPGLERAAAEGAPAAAISRRMRDVLRAELALGLVVLAATGALSGLAPASRDVAALPPAAHAGPPEVAATS